MQSKQTVVAINNNMGYFLGDLNFGGTRSSLRAFIMLMPHVDAYLQTIYF